MTRPSPTPTGEARSGLGTDAYAPPREPSWGRRLTGLILAAGYSSRMGSLKPLESLGGRSLLARAARLFRAAGLERLVLVLGHRAELIMPEAESLGLRAVVNPDYDAGMLSSVQAGIASLPAEAEAVLVLPVDIPLVRPATVRRLIAAWLARRPAAALPTFSGQTGHPPVIDLALRQGILAYDGPGGLGGFLEAEGRERLLVPVADRFILEDADTPDDLARLRRAHAGRALPDREECLAMLEVCGATPELVAHSRAVTAAALALGRALEAAGHPQDLALIRAGALLHDVGKGRPGHAAAGAELVEAMGFGRAARVVLAHLDLPEPHGDGLGADEVVHLADKLVKGDRLVGLDERFGARRAEPGSPAALAVARRGAEARQLLARVEAALGESAADFLRREAPDDLSLASR